MDEYYRLNFARKPEHLGLDPKKPLLAKPVFSATANGNEAGRRDAQWTDLRAHVEKLSVKIPADQGAAFFEIVLYPVWGAAAANRRGDLFSRFQAGLGGTEAGAADLVGQARAVHEGIQDLTKTFNEKISGGKWRGIMSPAPRDLAVFKFPDDATLAALKSATMETAKDDEPAARVVVEAEHASGRTAAGGAAWKTINGIGYNGAATSVWPTTGATVGEAEIRKNAARLDFAVTLTKAGEWKFTARTLPNWPLVPGKPARYAVALDDGEPQLVTLPKYTEENNPVWQEDVLRSASLTTAKLTVVAAGAHTLHVWSVDAGVVFDAFMLEREGAAPAGYLWPSETRTGK